MNKRIRRNTTAQAMMAPMIGESGTFCVDRSGAAIGVEKNDLGEMKVDIETNEGSEVGLDFQPHCPRRIWDISLVRQSFDPRLSMSWLCA